MTIKGEAQSNKAWEVFTQNLYDGQGGMLILESIKERGIQGWGVGVRNQVCSMPINPNCPTKRHLVSATKACKVVLRLLNRQLTSALGLQ